MSRKNGGIIGPANTPVGGLFKGVAGGVWRMNDVANFVSNSQWPTGPQSIDNSLRFNDGSADTLSINMGTSSSRRIWTLSTWIKLSRDTNGDNMNIVGTGGSSDQNHIGFDGSGSVGNTRIALRHYNGSSSDVHIQSNMTLNDQSAWYHVVYSVDTTQGTDTNRVKIYVNGTQVTSLATSTYPSQNFDWDFFQNGSTTYIGRRGHSSAYLLDGYLAETVWIDGQQLDPTSFGEFDTTTGIWKPKKIGSFTSAGTSSFYLDFKDSSNVGKDASGLSNNFTVNNLTSIDQSTDTCVVNYATFNPLIPSTLTYSDGNLTIEKSSGDWESSGSTIAVTKGKWYAEFKWVSGTYTIIGVEDMDLVSTWDNEYIGYSANGRGYGWDGNARNNASSSSFGNSFSTGDIIGVALDMDNNKVYFSKNGTFQNSGDPTSGSTGTGGLSLAGSLYTIGASGYSSVVDANFGSPEFSISSGNSDANGFGNFEYAVPSGYYALNTSNLNTYG